jgi:hypothetical protein
MPKGPRGEKRPADSIGAAIMVAKIATGEIEDTRPKIAAKSASGKKGAAARAAKLTDQQRTQIAQKGATARWKKKTALAD